VAFAPQKPALSETESDARANDSKSKKVSAFGRSAGDSRLGLDGYEEVTQSAQDPGAIVVGYGPVRQTVTRLLAEFEINPIILETNVRCP
jgi:hypothetical protein